MKLSPEEIREIQKQFYKELDEWAAAGGDRIEEEYDGPLDEGEWGGKTWDADAVEVGGRCPNLDWYDSHSPDNVVPLDEIWGVGDLEDDYDEESSP